MIELIRPRRVRLGLDMAPLIDVVFLLLIFFMLTSRFSHPVIRIDLPQAVTQDQVDQESIMISVTEQGDIHLNGQPTSLERLQSELQTTLSVSAHKIVHIQGDAELRYRAFIQIMDITRLAGAEQVNLVHQGSEQGFNSP